MALTLECNCGGTGAGDVCFLSDMKFYLDWDAHNDLIQAPQLAIARLTASGGLSTGDLDVGDFGSTVGGSYVIDLLPLGDWVTAWSTLNIHFETASSLHLGTSYPGAYNHIRFKIVQHYICLDINGAATQYDVTANGTGGDDQKCYDGGTPAGGLEFWGFGVANDGYIIQVHSGPLAYCGGVAINLLGFLPPPVAGGMSSSGPPGSGCLCAVGGSGNYIYSIVAGSLPAGQTLNAATGCIEGTPNGTGAGTKTVTFRVTDGGVAGGNGGGSVTVTGTCNTFGTGATRISGTPWTASMNGQAITINGVGYTVGTVTPAYSGNPADTLTLTSSAGIQTAVDWSYTYTVAPPTNGVPETADATCFIGGGGCGPGSASAFGNVQY